jgi:hypothetical protein
LRRVAAWIQLHRQPTGDDVRIGKALLEGGRVAAEQLEPVVDRCGIG